MNVKAKLDSNLSAKVSGKLTAECGIISESVGLSGKVTAKGVTGSGKADFSATIDPGTSCLDTLKLTSFKLDYDDIKVEIDGLGIFNEFLKPLIDLIDAVFGGLIKTEVADALKPVITDLLGSVMPYCMPTAEKARRMARRPRRARVV